MRPPPARLVRVPALQLSLAPACCSQNVAAHEAGHLIVLAALGQPAARARLHEFGGEVAISYSSKPVWPAAEPPTPPRLDDDARREERVNAYRFLCGRVAGGNLIGDAIGRVVALVAGLAGEPSGAEIYCVCDGFRVGFRNDFDHRVARIISWVLLGMVAVPVAAPLLARYILAENRELHTTVTAILERDGVVDLDAIGSDIRGSAQALLDQFAFESLPLVEPEAFCGRMLQLLRDCAGRMPDDAHNERIQRAAMTARMVLPCRPGIANLLGQQDEGTARNSEVL